jgi:hypothetical protein
MILHIALGIVLGFFLLHLVIWGGVLVIAGILKVFEFMGEHPVFTIFSIAITIMCTLALLHG